MRELKEANPSGARKDLVHEWAVKFCECELDLTAQGRCDAGSVYAWDDCPDPERYPLNPRTNDISISRAQLIADPDDKELRFPDRAS